MLITIQVTAEDIANGDPSDESKHPIALAMARAIPDADDIEVYTDSVGYGLDDLDYRADLPGAAFMFVSDIDEGKAVGPIEFDIYPAMKMWGESS